MRNAAARRGYKGPVAGLVRLAVALLFMLISSPGWAAAPYYANGGSAAMTMPMPDIMPAPSKPCCPKAAPACSCGTNAFRALPLSAAAPLVISLTVLRYAVQIQVPLPGQIIRPISPPPRKLV
ncbi:hypothetical protein [Acidocella aminolytica]|uniref:hypothetical protein n=1 Tax=Acidocella aminolytica TaxID=33998 RepID=UPI0006622F0C|nr:hypothetical protein [Acidocella aminolytica]SHF25942.1 hypothetical protein SAMN02746095_02620 [Acidocella aminolytica 101 = DSM 11237]